MFLAFILIFYILVFNENIWWTLWIFDGLQFVSDVEMGSASQPTLKLHSYMNTNCFSQTNCCCFSELRTTLLHFELQLLETCTAAMEVLLKLALRQYLNILLYKNNTLTSMMIIIIVMLMKAIIITMIMVNA